MSNEWKPIETAPKDGTHILVWRNGQISEAWIYKNWSGDYVWGGAGWSFPDWDMPTFWMPKPEAPVMGGDK